MSPSSLPTGTVTFFFSDVEGSTGLLQRLADGYRDVIERHAQIIRAALASHSGVEVSTEGDSFFAVFTSAADAVAAAYDIQQALAAEEWPEGGTVAVRIGLHTGTGELGHDNYVGLDVNRAARISAAGHGGQVVVSGTVRGLAAAAEYLDLGEHKLKGLDNVERLYQLDVPGLPQSFPPLRTDSSRPNNLPKLAARIVGRDLELVSVQALLDTNRLVTLTGPGGVGKTRLALEVATEALTHYERGAFFVDLAPLDDPALVLSEIAVTLGIVEQADADLANALRDGPRLLVLDNFEQVISAAPDLAALMANAEPVTVLVTSQLPLRVGGEHLYRLDPLGVTGDAGPAVDLFVSRAQQADPAFDANLHHQELLDLVRALDGVPLAIELAAARVNVLTPGEILERLGRGIDVLRSTRSDAPDRHRSLEAAVAWSYDLLNEKQQILLQFMSVFRGGTTVRALESVAGSDPIDDLAELVDRHLVRAEPGKIGRRFYLKPPVHAFVEQQVLDPDELAVRHARFFTELSADAHDPLEGDTRARWLAVLSDEHDNLRATMDHLLDSGQVEAGYLMLYGIWRYLQSSGQLSELGLWLQRFFDADSEASPTEARARALVARAAYFYWRGQWAEAVADYQAALPIAESVADQNLIGEILFGLTQSQGNAADDGLALGDPEETARRAHQVMTDLGNKAAVAGLEFGMELMRTIWGPEPAQPDRDTMVRILRLYEEAGSLMNVAQTHITLTQMDCASGDFAGARRNAITAIDTAERAGDTFTMGWALHWIAIAIVELGDPSLGARLAGAAAAAEQRLGGKFPDFPWFEGTALERARGLIGADADAAFSDGRDVGMAAAIAEARGFLPSA